MLQKNNLENIIGSRSKIKLIRFLSKSGEWQFNLAAVSKSAGIDKGALSRIIREFESVGILEVKRSGKLLLFRLNEKNRIISKLIVPFFAKEIEV
jgi:hypothetical protein